MRLVWLGGLLLAAEGVGAQVLWPDWFWAPRGVGWVEVFASSESEALETASRVLAAYRSSTVEGEFQQFYDEAIDDSVWQHTDYRVLYDEQYLPPLGGLMVWDRALVVVLTGQALYLVGPARARGPGPVRLGEPPRVPPASMAPQAGRIQAVGRYTLRGNPADAWVKAEDLALLELLNSQRMDLRQYVGVRQEGTRETLSRVEWIRLHFRVGSLQIDGRWVDPESGDALVAVSAPEGAVVALE